MFLDLPCPWSLMFGEQDASLSYLLMLDREGAMPTSTNIALRSLALFSIPMAI